jgi:hypothetical protein
MASSREVAHFRGVFTTPLTVDLEHPERRPYIRRLHVADKVGAKARAIIYRFRKASGLVEYPRPFGVFRGKAYDADLTARQCPRDFLKAAAAFFYFRI